MILIIDKDKIPFTFINTFRVIFLYIRSFCFIKIEKYITT